MPWQFKGIFLIVFHYFWQHPSPPLSFNSSPYLHRPKEQRGKKALCLGAYCDHEWDTHWPNHHGILKQDSSVGGFNFFNNKCKSSWEEGTLWIRRSQFPPVLKTAVPSGLTAIPIHFKAYYTHQTQLLFPYFLGQNIHIASIDMNFHGKSQFILLPELKDTKASLSSSSFPPLPPLILPIWQIRQNLT